MGFLEMLITCMRKHEAAPTVLSCRRISMHMQQTFRGTFGDTTAASTFIVASEEGALWKRLVLQLNVR